MTQGTARTPLIGVTGMWANSVHGLRFDGLAAAIEVLRSIVRAGGEPVILFPGSETDPDERYDALDGVVVPGGADVDPTRYGAQADATTKVTDHPGQDEADLTVIRGCIERKIPLLLICRGMQLLNVDRGGNMIQHIPTSPINHVDSTHLVDVAPHSNLGRALHGQDPMVSSYHHQGVDRVGKDLVVVGRAEDHIIEALEIPGVPMIAVQWHPEDNAVTSPTDHALFQWVVDAARDHHAAKNERRSAQQEVSA
ncbi:gamma-glutamyl-gamma-aminobutyrate hydrolase family protein [Arthrobacter sp. MDB2-24]